MTGSGSVGATFQVCARLGVGSSGEFGKAILISLKSVEMRTRRTWAEYIMPRYASEPPGHVRYLCGDLNIPEVLGLLQRSCTAVAHIDQPIEQKQQAPCLFLRERMMRFGEVLHRPGNAGKGARAVPSFLAKATRVHAVGDVPFERLNRKVGCRALAKA